MSATNLDNYKINSPSKFFGASKIGQDIESFNDLLKKELYPSVDLMTKFSACRNQVEQQNFLKAVAPKQLLEIYRRLQDQQAEQDFVNTCTPTQRRYIFVNNVTFTGHLREASYLISTLNPEEDLIDDYVAQKEFKTIFNKATAQDQVNFLKGCPGIALLRMYETHAMTHLCVLTACMKSVMQILHPQDRQNLISPVQMENFKTIFNAATAQDQVDFFQSLQSQKLIRPVQMTQYNIRYAYKSAPLAVYTDCSFKLANLDVARHLMRVLPATNIDIFRFQELFNQCQSYTSLVKFLTACTDQQLSDISKNFEPTNLRSLIFFMKFLETKELRFLLGAIQKKFATIFSACQDQDEQILFLKEFTATELLDIHKSPNFKLAVLYVASYIITYVRRFRVGETKLQSKLEIIRFNKIFNECQSSPERMAFLNNCNYQQLTIICSSEFQKTNLRAVTDLIKFLRDKKLLSGFKIDAFAELFLECKFLNDQIEFLTQCTPAQLVELRNQSKNSKLLDYIPLTPLWCTGVTRPR